MRQHASAGARHIAASQYQQRLGETPFAGIEELIAQTGLQFDLRSAQGKLIASLMAALAEFERDLLREWFRSGIAAARKRGVVFGRRPGQRVKADRYGSKVLKLVGEAPVVPGNEPPTRFEQEHGT